MESVKDVYCLLLENLDTMPVGFPPTEWGAEIRLLQHLFTPKEAEIALNLSALPEELAVGMLEFQVDRITREFTEDFYEYEKESFRDELFGGKTGQLRTIPVHESITNERYVARYDDTRSLVTNSPGPHAVINCICRQTRDAMGEPRRQTVIRETCIVFEEFASVYQASVGRDLCTGCGKCVEHRQLDAVGISNGVADVDLDRCIGCGLCTTTCESHALTIVRRER